jgi:site-specific recombinase XerD
MMHLFIKSVKKISQLKLDPLGPYVDEFIKLLRNRGHSPGIISRKLFLVSEFNRWLIGKKIELKDLDHPKICQFILFRKKQISSFIDGGDNATLNLLINILREHKAIPLKPPESGPIELLLKDFTNYLFEEKGITLSTVRYYTWNVRKFLIFKYNKQNRLDFNDLGARDIHEFLLDNIKNRNRGYVKLICTSLRAFFRFLLFKGEISRDLSMHVLTVANWRNTSIPYYLKPHEIQMLLESCNLETFIGKRNYAILLLLARFGLRGCEIANLTLDDFDWGNAEMIIHSKGKKSGFPIHEDIGKAIADYIKDGRPKCSTRRLFIRSYPPYKGFKNSSTVGAIVRSAIRYTGLKPPKAGCHLLRHTAANQMLRGGASLFQIGKILRHENVNTTSYYAKVDFQKLRTIVQPWPIKNNEREL